MLQALENLKEILNDFQAMLTTEETHLKDKAEALLARVEAAIGRHTAAPSIPGIEVTEGAPDGGYPPINQVSDECATPVAEVLASPTADAAPAAEAVPAASDPAPAAPQV